MHWPALKKYRFSNRAPLFVFLVVAGTLLTIETLCSKFVVVLVVMRRQYGQATSTACTCVMLRYV